MLALILSDLANLDVLMNNPWLLLLAAFSVWMLVDAIRHEEWFWAVFIFLFAPINAPLYYFLVLRRRAARFEARTIESKTDARPEREKELLEQIKMLDKAHHHHELGLLLLEQGRTQEALNPLHEAVRREPEDLDMQASLAKCLIKLKRPGEARALLENVTRVNPDHAYGSTKMDLAESQTALGDKEKAMVTWQEILKSHSYPRAQVQLAELYLAFKQPGLARQQLEEVLEGEKESAGFGNRRDHIWIHRARALMRDIPSDTLPA